MSALLHRLPVKTMGRALYDIPGLTHQGSLDDCWQSPQPVDEQLFKCFHSLLFRETQVNGSFFKHFELTCNNVLMFFQTLMKKREVFPAHTSFVPAKTLEGNKPEIKISDIPLEAA